jgi:hypothetical protein
MRGSGGSAPFPIAPFHSAPPTGAHGKRREPTWLALQPVSVLRVTNRALASPIRVAQLRLTTLLANNAIGEWFTSRGRPHETSTRRLRREIRHRVRRTDHVQMGNREGGKKSPFTRAPHERIGWAFRSKFVTIADRPHPSRHLSGTITLFGGLAKDRIAAGYQHASLNDPLTGVANVVAFSRQANG